MFSIWFALLLCTASANKLVLRDLYVPNNCERKVVVGRGVWINYAMAIAESSEYGTKGEIVDTEFEIKPYHFIPGQEEVIEGIDKGVLGMCVGGKRLMIVPPHMSFTSNEKQNIVARNATLKIVVVVKQVMEELKHQNVFEMVDIDGSMDLTKDEIEAFFKKRNKNVPSALWETEDTNNDGVISWSEFRGPKGIKKRSKHKNKNI